MANEPNREKQVYLELCNYLVGEKNQSYVVLTMDKLKNKLKNLCYRLTDKQVQQLFIYASHDSRNKTNPVYIVFGFEEGVLDIKYIAKWICNKKIQKSKFNSHKSLDNKVLYRRDRVEVKEKKQQKPQPQHRRVKTDAVYRLPQLKTKKKVEGKLNHQLSEIIGIFEKMRRERENYGLIPIKVDEDESDYECDDTNIPYSSELHSMNKSINDLKLRAKQKIKKIIQIARDDKKIHKKLQNQLYKKYKERLDMNDKIGRLGSMKAQKRIFEERAKEIEKMKAIQKHEEKLKRISNEDIKTKFQVSPLI